MDNELLEKQSFSDLYGYFCGMMTREKLDVLDGQMMGAIPDLGSVKGNIIIENQFGIKNNRK